MLKHMGMPRTFKAFYSCCHVIQLCEEQRNSGLLALDETTTCSFRMYASREATNAFARDMCFSVVNFGILLVAKTCRSPAHYILFFKCMD